MEKSLTNTILPSPTDTLASLASKVARSSIMRLSKVLSVRGVCTGATRGGATVGGGGGVSCLRVTTGLLPPTGVGMKLSPTASAALAFCWSCASSFLLYSSEPSPPACPLMASERVDAILVVTGGFFGANNIMEPTTSTASTATPRRANIMKRRFFSVLVMLMASPHHAFLRCPF